MVEPAKPQMTMPARCMLDLVSLHARGSIRPRPCTTHARARAILYACLRQLWFRERASVLRYTYFACLVYYHLI